MLADNRRYFHKRIRIANLLYKSGNYEECINYVEQTAKFGWFNFTGYYKSAKLENLLEKIGKKVLPKFSTLENVRAESKRKILHIASEIYTSGGHSKLLFNWIRNDSESNHSVFVTRLTTDQCEDIAAYYNSTSKCIIGGLKNSKIETAISLQNELRKNYDYIILHIHPDETITNIVLTDSGIETSVLFLNHADHTFWLGIQIADYLIQIREANITLDAQRRGFPKERQFFLPIPIDISVSDKKISGDIQLKLLSTGTAYKYEPNKKYDFLREIDKILSRHRNVSIDIVGLSAESEYAKKHPHDRITYHGIINSQKLNELEDNTDIYIEGFPMASFTALLQTALKKKPFLLHYDALPIFRLFNNNTDNCINYPRNIEKWHEEVDRLITDQNYRAILTERQFYFLKNNFSLVAWKKNLIIMYNSTIEAKENVITQDCFFEGENEKILETLDNTKIKHYTHTDSLNFLNKLKVLFAAKRKNQNVIYIDDHLKFTTIFRYLLG